MINICTVSDFNYLFKGLALYESLVSKNKDIVLHYLCLDKKAHDFLKKHESSNLKIYDVDDLANQNPLLKSLKEREYKYFCWSMASYFTNYLMEQNIGDITYIDSDILFYHDIKILLDNIGEKEIAIFRHRQFPFGKDRIEGYYNVGVMHFKNQLNGKKVLNWWSDAVLHKKYPHLSTCGDQKYLDEFVNLCPVESIFIDGNIGHGAPWQWQLYDFSDYFKDGTITWKGEKQLLLFSHFSSFSYDIEKDTYIPSMQHHIYTPMQDYTQIPELKQIHEHYFNEIKKVIKKYENYGPK